MPKYYKYDIDDLKELHEACRTVGGLNKWVDGHYRYTCSCCGRDELYHQSPVLGNEMWNGVCKTLGLEYPNGKHPNNIGRTYRLPRDKDGQAAVRFYRFFDEIGRVRGDDTYTMLCRGCVEKALGRPLVKADLPDCGLNRMHIDEYGD